MGWLFGSKKKVPKVPLPEGFPLEEGALRFPGKFSKERIIEPEQIKEAAGIRDFSSFPEEDNGMEEFIPKAPEKLTPLSTKVKPLPVRSPATFEPKKEEPLFIQVEVYREILGEIEGLKHRIANLYEINKNLESSEYNEETHFTKLRKGVKSLHDRSLQVDKILFSS